jgi:hypothetical protein
VSLAEFFEVDKAKYEGIHQGGLFADLGPVCDIQRTSKGVIADALLLHFSECWGMELLHGLYSVSERLKEAYDINF